MRKNRAGQEVGLHQHILDPSEAAGIPLLPPLSVDRMNQIELRDFIPHLLKIVTGRTDRINKDSKPEWWPPDVPWSATKTDIRLQEATWTEMLRNVVRSCYKHLGQENQLQRGQNQGMQNSKRTTRSNSPLLNSYRRGIAVSQRSHLFAEIYICFFCEREFTNPDVMRKHQSTCKDRPPDLQQIPNTPPSHKNLGKEPPQMSPVKRNLSEKFLLPSKEVFVKLINIIPKQRAAKMLARCRNSLDVECNKIDISEPATPISPSTPRTPKSLISQLSREDSVCSSKKRLSYSEREDDKESVASGCSEESEDKHTQKGKSLLTIDISSLLGQRIQKHVKLESAVQVVENSESFCKTPVKNTFYEKLRNRPVLFPVTYKPRRKVDQKFCHKYHFTKKQKRLQSQKLYTGLNHASRKLKQSLPKSTVLIQKLTKRELKKWMDKKSYREFMGLKPDVKTKECVFPTEPVLLSKDVDQLLGLKKRSSMGVKNPLRSPLSLGNVVSEDVNAEASRQKLTLYRCLLSEMTGLSSALKGTSSSTALQKSMKKQLMKDRITGYKGKEKGSKHSESAENPRNMFSSPNTSANPVKVELPSPPDSLLDFKTLRRSATVTDDDISVISVESDEESLNSGCCSSCKRKKYCQRLPDPLVKLTSIDGCRPMSKTPDLKSSIPVSSKIPLGVPLQISPSSSSSIGSPQASPCSCSSSPRSELDFIQKTYPSPTPSVESNSSLNVNPVKANVKGYYSKESPKLDARQTRSSPMKKTPNTFKSPGHGSVNTRNYKNTIDYRKLMMLPQSCQRACSAVLGLKKEESRGVLHGRLLNPTIAMDKHLDLKSSPSGQTATRFSSGIAKTPEEVLPSLSLIMEKPSNGSVFGEKNVKRKSVPERLMVTRAKSVSPKKQSSLYSSAKQSDVFSKSPLQRQSECNFVAKQPFQERQQCSRDPKQMSHEKSHTMSLPVQNFVLSNRGSPMRKSMSSFESSFNPSSVQTRSRPSLVMNALSWKQVGLVSPMRRAVSLSGSLSDSEPIRRSKRLLSGSSSDGGSPRKLRKIETK